MKLIVFSENQGLRKYIEDLLTSTPYNFESMDLRTMLTRGKIAGFDGLLADYDSWQRCASLFRYFGILDALNGRPMIIFSKNKKLPAVKLRPPKVFTGHCSVPPQSEELYTALQQMSGALVNA